MYYPVANQDIRKAMKQAGVPMWAVAKSIGIAENTLSRWLRVELEPIRKVKILDGISMAKEEKEKREEKLAADLRKNLKV